MRRVLHVNHPSHQNPVAELLAPLVVALQKQHSFTHVLAPASTFGKNLIPRVGGLLDVAPISEVMGTLAATPMCYVFSLHDFLAQIFKGRTLSSGPSTPVMLLPP